MTDIDPFASATELLAALRGGRVSSSELTDLYIRRIERHDGRLNAVVVRDFERARQRARAADDVAVRGERAPLLGLPITLKESFNVAGLETTCGVPEWKGYVSAHDAPAAARLRAAGAVLLGKTNVPPALADWQSDNPIHGRTNNPWDTGRSPGGSSGGSAAALAAGLTALEVGSDIGGSIRVPAAFCGVYGHRPSETLLPKSGQFPMPPLPNAAVVMGVQGPLARSAEDLELALSVLAGPDVGEDVAWRVELPSARRERLADFRVAVLPPIPWLGVDGQIAGALDDLATRLGRLGCAVKQAQPENLGDHREHHGLYRSLLSAVTSARIDEESRRQRIAMYEKADDEFSRAHLRGLTSRPGDYIVWNARREQYRAAWRAFFREWDVLLSPAMNVLAYPHVARAWPPDDSDLTLTFTIDGRAVPYLHGLAYPALSTVAGQPATAFPVGRSREGLPIGLQAIGPYLEDRTPIRFAALLAREAGDFIRPPGYDAS
ncbi:MAG TPA: amidase [Methylomirabilota bacterium]|jgi:amidase|nr:amidase [Methylomirabilota bacterium]